MVKILFVNPIVRAEDAPRHVPYGIAMLASLAMKAGHQVQVFDHNAWRLNDDVLKDVMQADEWDVIAAGGITTAYSSLKTIFESAKTYSEKSITICGGGMLTSMPHDIMSFIKQIDIGVIGEAYVTFPELLDAIGQSAASLDDVAGLCLRKNNETYFTKSRPLLADLDSLPYPAWELFPLEEVYFPNSSVALAEESMTATRRLDINTSYGCSLICRYCFHLGLSGDMAYVEGDGGKADVVFDMPGNHSRNIRYHSPRYIIDMVKYMVERFQVNFVSFLDENLMTMDQYSKRTWMKEICNLWIKEGLQPKCRQEGVLHDENCTHGVHWGGTSHATLCTQDILQMMGNAGCSYLDYGWESFSPRILKSIGKGATPANNIKSYNWTMQAGIRPIPNQMIGFPSEDFESLRDTMKAWDRLGIVTKPFFVTPYPGCEWYGMYKDKILSQYNGKLENYVKALGDATDITATISENFNAVELYGLRELMIRGDFDKLDAFEKEWVKLKGDPQEGVARADAKMKEKVPLSFI
ncbi:MAG: B12-binding domain-containing radical SAM protein [Methylocystaceae bacterium]|nr:B12-binding domain-containing radical SAM protein [Methylocystaceae bacterium]